MKRAVRVSLERREARDQQKGHTGCRQPGDKVLRFNRAHLKPYPGFETGLIARFKLFSTDRRVKLELHRQHGPLSDLAVEGGDHAVLGFDVQ